TETKGSRYADPVLYENGKLRTDTNGRYGPDLEVDFLKAFMAHKSEAPFFAYHSMTLTHGPFNMTPRSAGWARGERLRNDPSLFGDMVEYMDDCIGRLLAYLDETGLARNTLVLFYSDNGSPPEVVSRMGDRVVPGGKGTTADAGMHVPLIAHWPGAAKQGSTCRDLIDSTDFVPTLMEAAGSKWYADRPVDGRSFLPQIRGGRGIPRETAFAHYDPHPGCKVNFTPTRLAWDHRHKLYMDGRLFDMQVDPHEKRPVEGQADVRRKLQGTLEQMAQVCPPKFNNFDSDGRQAY
ncbi:MAG TPA: sulfatase-like hydrolase/transferase, partial [Bryobacteraceae bacterium]|nr:sulfatase-like hydrolase/transferase [Bryobacteraceae bacterium]